MESDNIKARNKTNSTHYMSKQNNNKQDSFKKNVREEEFEVSPPKKNKNQSLNAQAMNKKVLKSQDHGNINNARDNSGKRNQKNIINSSHNQTEHEHSSNNYNSNSRGINNINNNNNNIPQNQQYNSLSPQVNRSEKLSTNQQTKSLIQNLKDKIGKKDSQKVNNNSGSNHVRDSNKKMTNKFIQNISNNSTKQQQQQVQNLSMGSQSEDRNEYSDSIEHQKKTTISSTSQQKQLQQQQLLQQNNPSTFTAQFSVSPSNAERIQSDSSNSKLLQDEQQYQQFLMQQQQFQLIQQSQSQQSNPGGTLKSQQVKLQNLFPLMQDQYQNPYFSAERDIQETKNTLVFKKYEDKCYKFLKKEAQMGKILDIPEYCTKLYNFLSQLNPNIKLFTTIRQMIEAAMNQIIYDFTQVKAQTMQQSSNLEALENMKQEHELLNQKFDLLQKENYNLANYVGQLKKKESEMRKSMSKIKNTDYSTCTNSNNANSLSQTLGVDIGKLIKENEKLRNLAKKQKKQLQQTQEKEEKIMKLLYAIRKKGIDIESIYNDDVRTPENEMEELMTDEEEKMYNQHDNKHQINNANYDVDNQYDIYAEKAGFYPQEFSNEDLQKQDQYIQLKNFVKEQDYEDLDIQHGQQQQKQQQQQAIFIHNQENQKYIQSNEQHTQSKEEQAQSNEYQTLSNEQLTSLNQNKRFYKDKDVKQFMVDYQYNNNNNNNNNESSKEIDDLISYYQDQIQNNNFTEKPNQKQRERAITEVDQNKKLKLDLSQIKKKQNNNDPNSNEPVGFHQEFMAKFSEFSESWRQAAMQEKKF